ncbi:GNAT family N-acetyltransferase [Nocardia suismassiliense]|uniref:GNAT family N-acetyltransferase n=1 Tax=Nocardia suismassiliense TaxID=2077092 RepID=A0ABW6QMC5_9NOCA
MEIRSFDVDRASEAELVGYHHLVVASAAVDAPEVLPLSYDTVLGDLRHPHVAFGPTRHWAAWGTDGLVGFARVGFPGAENTHVAMVEITVLPQQRRRGIGTELLQTVQPALRADGRTLLQGWAVVKGGAGDHWAAALGFECVHTGVRQRLVFAETDQSLWEVDPPPGYRLARWVSEAPEELVASYAHAKGAIRDMPAWAVGYQIPDWTAERMRAEEVATRERGIERRVVVAVCEATGAVVGITEVMLYPHRADQALQGDTAVLAAHRGYGLGRCLKAAMARWLVADKPQLKWVNTSSAVSNSHMLRVNRQIGYHIVRTTIVVEHAIADLESAGGTLPSASG